MSNTLNPQAYLPGRLTYSAAEEPLAQQVHEHQSAWKEAFRRHPEWRTGNATREDFVEDGFYPGYTASAVRVLFVGREARSLGGCSYLEHLWNAYRNTKVIDDRPLSSNKFHAVMLRLAYGFLHGFPEWHDLPAVHAIADSLGSPRGISFAFMNLSKLSNERHDSAKADWGQIAFASRISTGSRNWIAEEIALLRPDVVVTANLGRHLGALGEATPQAGIEGFVEAFRLLSNGHQCILLNTFHFSARKKMESTFYAPISKWWSLHSGEVGGHDEGGG